MGNEAVDQLTKFNRSLRDFSGGAGNPRGIDGMILTKCVKVQLEARVNADPQTPSRFDTIDDKVRRGSLPHHISRLTFVR